HLAHCSAILLRKSYKVSPTTEGLQIILITQVERNSDKQQSPLSVSSLPTFQQGAHSRFLVHREPIAGPRRGTAESPPKDRTLQGIYSRCGLAIRFEKFDGYELKFTLESTCWSTRRQRRSTQGSPGRISRTPQ